jgi:hypothetical protein
MYPVIAQAIAAEQARELQAHAAAARRTRQPRRSRHAVVRAFAWCRPRPGPAADGLAAARPEGSLRPAPAHSS